MLALEETAGSGGCPDCAWDLAIGKMKLVYLQKMIMKNFLFWYNQKNNKLPQEKMI